VRVYLDNSAYSLVSERGETKSVRDALDAIGAVVVASQTNIDEFWPIRAEAQRAREIANLTGLATALLELPDTYSQAQEMISEAHRCHPEWLSGRSNAAELNERLEFNAYEWATLNADPTALPADYESHRTFTETVIKSARQTQRGYREKFNDVRRGTFSLGPVDSEFDAVVDALKDEDRYWRYGSARYWEDALGGQNQGVDDLRHFAEPAIQALPYGREFRLFWLRDVKAKGVPYHHITGLTELYQLEHPIGHGNPHDINHSPHLADVEVFITGDKAFYAQLVAVSSHIDRVATPVLVDRAAPSALSEIRAGLLRAGFSL